MATGKVGNGQPIAYEEFEPYCKWQRKDDRDVLELQLPEFKKEQLKVQISNHGILKISGERPLIDASTHSKFYKEVPVPNNKYDTHSIHAKFVNNWLIITLPKLKPTLSDLKASSSEPPKIDQNLKPAAATTAPDIGGECKLEGRKRPRLAKVAISLAATAAAVAVLVAYVVYMYKSTVPETED